MIANSTELRAAMRNLRLLEIGLDALRKQLKEANPALLEVSAKSYARWIKATQSEIADYLYNHPTDVSLLLPSLDALELAER